MAEIINYIENGFDYIGLMRGPYAPVKRATFCALIATGVVCYLQPQSMFIGGNPRPWDMITKNPKDSNIPPTVVPWFFAPLAAAVFGGVLI